MKFVGDLIPPMLTTVERDALPAVTGRIIYNTTTDKLEFFDGVQWTEASGGGGLTFGDLWAANTLMNC